MYVSGTFRVIIFYNGNNDIITAYSPKKWFEGFFFFEKKKDKLG